MFMVTLEDGRVIVEGKEAKAWDEVPTDSRIVAVALFDGGRLIDHLIGFDFYVCCYEDVGVQSMTASADGTVTVVGDLKQVTVAQQLWGIRTQRRLKKLVRETAHDMSVEINKAFDVERIGTNAFYAKAFDDQRKLLNERRDELLAKIDVSEVALVELRLAKKYLARDACTQSEEFLREGTPDESLHITTDAVREMLWPKPKEVNDGEDVHENGK